MIRTLHISNYALIDELEIEFGDGLSIITGETGAGKSIMLGALSLILGDRADTKTVRDKDQKTVVEATFDISSYHLNSFFAENDIVDLRVLERALRVLQNETQRVALLAFL